MDGVDPTAIGAYADLGVTEGSVAALVAPEGIMVTERHRPQLAPRPAGPGAVRGVRRHPLPVAATFTNPGPLTGYLVSLSTLTADSGVRVDTVDLVRAPAVAPRAPPRAR